VPATVVTLTPHLYKNRNTASTPTSRRSRSSPRAGSSLAVNPGIGVNSLDDLLKMARAQPGKVNFAPPTINTTPHLAGEVLAMLAGVKFYSGALQRLGAAVTATITNESQVHHRRRAAARLEHQGGQAEGDRGHLQGAHPGLRERSPVADTFKGFEAIGWFAVLAPAKTPAAMVERMNKDVNAVAQMPDIVSRYAELGIYPRPGTVQQAAEFLASERKLWGKVIKRPRHPGAVKGYADRWC